MRHYLAAGIIFQTIVLERDDNGNVVAEHIMPPAKAHWPYASVALTVEEQVAEFGKQPGEVPYAPDQGR